MKTIKVKIIKAKKTSWYKVGEVHEVNNYVKYSKYSEYPFFAKTDIEHEIVMCSDCEILPKGKKELMTMDEIYEELGRDIKIIPNEY